MDSNRAFSNQGNISDMYEFQAFDKFLRILRGRVFASSRKQARSAVRKRGLLCIFLWPHGTEHWLARGRVGPPCVLVHAPTVRLKEKTDELVAYTCSTVTKYALSCLFGAIGLLLLAWPWISEGGIPPLGDTFERISSAFVFIMGVVFLAVSLFLLSMRFEIIAKRSPPRVTIKMSIIPSLWWSEVINGDAINKVVFRKEVHYTDFGELCYDVYLFTDKNEVMLDSSSSERREKELAQAVAECLQVPLVCEDAT